MIEFFRPRASWSLQGVLVASPSGRHRRGPTLPRRMVLAIAGYVGAWVAWSSVATLAAVR